MVTISLTKSEIISISSGLSSLIPEISAEQIRILEILNKLYRAVRERSIKKYISMNIDNYKRYNNIPDLQTYKRVT